GSQYTSSLFEGTLQNSGIHHSYSRKGHPYDNARIKSFHSLIKREMIITKSTGPLMMSGCLSSGT
ncbi:transposase, partial [Leuconostoc lactis]|nr:transposase [Leuconostoc lactis]